MKSIKGAFFIETSALKNSKVGELFYKAAETMYKFYKVSPEFRSLVQPDRTSFMPSLGPPPERFSL